MKIKIDIADKAFSLYVRTKAGWKCERCGAQHEEGSQGLHCSHFWGRGKENTRFDENNCSAICFGCHNFFHAHPAEYTKWKLAQLGEKKFQELDIRAHTLTKKDRKLALIYANQLLENLRNEISR